MRSQILPTSRSEHCNSNMYIILMKFGSSVSKVISWYFYLVLVEGHRHIWGINRLLCGWVLTYASSSEWLNFIAKNMQCKIKSRVNIQLYYLSIRLSHSNWTQRDNHVNSIMDKSSTRLPLLFPIRSSERHLMKKEPTCCG